MTMRTYCSCSGSVACTHFSKIPRHVGIILDGNGRWAECRGKERWEGHRQGANNIEPILFHAINRGVKVVTVYALSLDNIEKRPPRETENLYRLFGEKLDYVKKRFHEEDMRIRFLGDMSRLPVFVQEKAADVAEVTKKNTRGTFVMAMAYGGRDEIVRAVRKAQEVGGSDFSAYLDSANLPSLDLVIRTGVENPVITRLSDFMLWMSAYSEIYSTPCFWPEFTVDDLDAALAEYAVSKRKLGAVKARQDWGFF